MALPSTRESSLLVLDLKKLKKNWSFVFELEYSIIFFHKKTF